MNGGGPLTAVCFVAILLAACTFDVTAIVLAWYR